MRNPRRAMLVVGVFCGALALASGLQAQTNTIPSATSIAAFPNAQLQHVPSIRSGPIDLSKYSSDVLNCAICRERLGLPALVPSAASTNKPELIQPSASNPTQRFTPSTQQVNRPASEGDLAPKVGASFGASGLITAGTAKQLEASGLVIQEFRPPTPKPEDFRLESLPPEARKQFFQQLELPNGAKVMSAQIMSGHQEKGDATVIDAPTSPETIAPVRSPKETAPSIDANVQAPAVAQEETLQPAIKTNEAPIPSPIPAPDRSAAMAATLQAVEQMKAENLKLAEQLAVAAKEREKLQEMIRVQSESFEKKMAEIERSNQETAKMLEARTLEVTELQNQLKAQPKSQKRPKADSDIGKKKPSKNISKDR
ncbi:MAG: hypothetical protein ACK578_01945 [Pirellula sp.]